MFENFAESILNENLFGGDGGAVESVQYISALWGDTNTIKDIAIGSVNPDNTIVMIDFLVNDYADKARIAVSLLNSTTVRMHRITGLAHGANRIFRIKVIEFKKLKSKQTGIHAPTVYFAEFDVAIASVDKDKAVIIASSTSSGTTTSHTLYIFSTTIKNNTTITLMGETTTSIYWQVAELE